jgi:acyl dehydratase
MRRSSGVSRAFEDFPVGTRLVSACRRITAEAIIDFAREFDPQLFHLDKAAPNDNLLAGHAASGWQTAAISMRLFVETMQVAGGIVGLAVDRLRWPHPIRPGDELRVEIKILRARLSQSRPGYGIIRYRCLTKNQKNEVVQSFLAAAMLPARRTAGLPLG